MTRAASADRPLRTLMLVTPGYFPPWLEDIERDEAAGTRPRSSLFPRALGATLLDRRLLEQAPARRRHLYRALPEAVALALEAHRLRHDYDVVVSWSAEHIGIPFAVLQRLSGSPVPFVGLFSWVSQPGKAALLRAAGPRVDRLVLPSPLQYYFALERLGLPRDRVAYVPWAVDHEFWRPQERDTDLICSVGRERRDYPTLIEAVDGLDLRCHIAATRSGRGRERWVRAMADDAALPSNVTMAALDSLALRQLYARSRFVVMPLRETDSDNGITTILEAMAMGKAVICSRTAGQRDVVLEGKTGLYVRPGDPRGLRAAIEHLWDHPEEATWLGRNARRHVERHHTVDGFVDRLQAIVHEVVAGHRGRPAAAAISQRKARPA